MTRPTHFAKPRIKCSTIHYGFYLCWNNRCHAYGKTIEGAYKAWIQERKKYD